MRTVTWTVDRNLNKSKSNIWTYLNYAYIGSMLCMVYGTSSLRYDGELHRSLPEYVRKTLREVGFRTLLSHFNVTKHVILRVVTRSAASSEHLQV